MFKKETIKKKLADQVNEAIAKQNSMKNVFLNSRNLKALQGPIGLQSPASKGALALKAGSLNAEFLNANSSSAMLIDLGQPKSSDRGAIVRFELMDRIENGFNPAGEPPV